MTPYRGDENDINYYGVNRLQPWPSAVTHEQLAVDTTPVDILAQEVIRGWTLWQTRPWFEPLLEKQIFDFTIPIHLQASPFDGDI